MTLRSLLLSLALLGCSESPAVVDASADDARASDGGAVCIGSGLACDTALDPNDQCCFTRQRCIAVGDGTVGVCAYSEPIDAGPVGMCLPEGSGCTPRVGFDGYLAEEVCCNRRQRCFAIGDGTTGVCSYVAPADHCALLDERCESTAGSIRGDCCDPAASCRGGSCGR